MAGTSMSEQFEFDFNYKISDDLEKFAREINFSEKTVDHDQFMRAQKFREEATLLKKIFREFCASPDVDKMCIDTLWYVIEEHNDKNQRTIESG